jgi:hypothetical protein
VHLVVGKLGEVRVGPTVRANCMTGGVDVPDELGVVVDAGVVVSCETQER